MLINPYIFSTGSSTSGVDTFDVDDLANYTSDGSPAGTWVITGGQLRISPPQGGQSTLTRNSPSAINGWAEVDIVQANDAGIVINRTAVDKYLLLTIDDASSNSGNANKLRLFSRNGATFTAVGSVATIAFTRGTQHTVRLERSGASVTASFDGNVVITGTDATNNISGTRGMRANGSLSSGNVESIWNEFRWGVNGSDPYFSSVIDLLHFNNDMTDVTGRAWTVNGGITVDAAQSKFGGKSLLCGSGKYLQAANHQDFSFGIADFTIELWFYPTATPAGGGLVCTQFTTGNSLWTIAFCDGTIGSVGGALPYFGIFNGSTWSGVAGTSPLSLNTWHHIAVSRVGSVIRLFVDGVQAGSDFSFSGSMPRIILPAFIGRRHDTAGTTSYPSGYIDDVRISRGVGRYSSTFTPPIATFPDAGPDTDPLLQYVKSLMHFDGDYSDVKGNVWTADAGVTIDSTTPLVGAGSGKIIASEIHTPNSSNFNLGTSDFCIELTVRFDALPVSSAYALVARYATTTSGWSIQYRNDSGSSLAFNMAGDGNSATWAFTPTIGTTYRICIDRQGTLIRMFVNGAKVGSDVNLGTNDVSSGTYLSIGALYYISNAFIQKSTITVDEFRLTIGMSRHQDAYTPVLPFPGV